MDFPATQFPKALFWLCNVLMALVLGATLIYFRTGASRQAEVVRMALQDHTD